MGLSDNGNRTMLLVSIPTMLFARVTVLVRAMTTKAVHPLLKACTLDVVLLPFATGYHEPTASVHMNVRYSIAPARGAQVRSNA